MSAVLRKTTEPVGSVHFRNVCLGEARSSTLHRPCGQRRAARHSLWAGQARLHYASAPLRPHQTCRERGKASPCVVRRSLYPLRKCRPLRSRHILRGRAETRDCDSRCSAALHTVSHRLAERNRYVDTPLHLSLAYALQGLQFLRLHSVTQAPSAGTAHTSEGCCRCTFIRLSVLEPERPSSLASTVVPSGSCRACRLACSLSGRQKERCFRIALSDFLRVERWDIRTLHGQCTIERHHTPWV